MRTRLLLVGLLAIVNVYTYADIYKTKDKNGNVVYTDQPAASDTKAKVVTLPTINELPSVEPGNRGGTASNQQQADIHYNLEITSPPSGTRLLSNERSLTISVNSDQVLQDGHFFAYFLNGEKVGETTDLSTTITEPPRGENKVFVEVVDKYGKSFGQSPSIVVYVMRPIIKR